MSENETCKLKGERFVSRFARQSLPWNSNPTYKSVPLKGIKECEIRCAARNGYGYDCQSDESEVTNDVRYQD